MKQAPAGPETSGMEASSVVVEACRDRSSEIREPWPGFLAMRGLEKEILGALVEDPLTGCVADVGCGIGYHSAQLSRTARRVVAMDLPGIDAASHSRGLAPALRFLEACDARNVTLLGASAEALPLADGSLDGLYTAYTLEHVERQEQAIQELFRVLKPGGRAIVLVPGCAERIFAIPRLYWMLLGAVIRTVFGRPRKATPQTAAVSGAPRESRWRKFRRLYPHFPFPEPHGLYPSSWHEFRAHRASAWRGSFQRAGFRCERTFCTVWVPYNLLEAIHPSLAVAVYRASRRLTLSVAQWPWLRWLGHSVGFELRRCAD